MKVSGCDKYSWCHLIMTGIPPNLWILHSSCALWRLPISAPWKESKACRHERYRVSGKMYEPCSSLPASTRLALSFGCNVSCCSSSVDLVKRSSGVAWQQSSAALSLQSLCSAVRLPLESCQDFLLFLHRSTFSSALLYNSNILPHKPLAVSSLQSFPPPAFGCLFINRLFPPTRRMSKPDFLSSQHNMSCLC